MQGIKEKQVMSTNEADQARTKKQSRKNHKQAKKQEKQAAKDKRQTSAESATGKLTRKQQKAETKQARNEIPKSRILPIWLRIIIVLALSASALVVGLMIGYGMIGEGTPFDVLKKGTWQHIIDVVNKE